MKNKLKLLFAFVFLFSLSKAQNKFNARHNNDTILYLNYSNPITIYTDQTKNEIVCELSEGKISKDSVDQYSTHRFKAKFSKEGKIILTAYESNNGKKGKLIGEQKFTVIKTPKLEATLGGFRDEITMKRTFLNSLNKIYPYNKMVFEGQGSPLTIQSFEVELYINFQKMTFKCYGNQFTTQLADAIAKADAQSIMRIHTIIATQTIKNENKQVELAGMNIKIID